MKFDSSKTGLVRGYYVYATRYAGCIGLEMAKDENNLDVGVAYTYWYRCDEDPSIVEEELDRIVRCYNKASKCAGGIIGYEYRPFKK